MARLPLPGGDAGNWGEVLNEFLRQEHEEDGSLRSDGSLAAKANLDQLGEVIQRVDVEHDPTGALRNVARPSDIAELTLELSRQRYGNTGRYALATFGDSITGYATRYQSYMSMVALQRIRRVADLSYSGFTSGQLVAKVSDVLTLNPRPDGCLILCGANDGQGGVSVSAYGANIAAIAGALETGGITPIIGTSTPLDNPSWGVRTNGYAAWVRQFAATRNYPIIDIHAAVADPLTGFWRSGLGGGDGVHPSSQGLATIGRTIADSLSPLYARLPATSVQLSQGEPNLWTNSFAVVDGNSNGIADGWTWSGGGGRTPSLIPDVAGGYSWQTAIHSGATGTSTLKRSVGKSGGNYQDGDLLRIGLMVNTISTMGIANINVVCYSSAFAVLYNKAFASVAAPVVGHVVHEFLVPSGTSSIELNIQHTAPDGEYRYALPTLINLTALGLD